MALYRNQPENNKAISGEISLFPVGHRTRYSESMADITGDQARDEKIIWKLTETLGNRSTATCRPPVPGGDKNPCSSLIEGRDRSTVTVGTKIWGPGEVEQHSTFRNTKGQN